MITQIIFVLFVIFFVGIGVWVLMQAARVVVNGGGSSRQNSGTLPRPEDTSAANAAALAGNSVPADECNTHHHSHSHHHPHDHGHHHHHDHSGCCGGNDSSSSSSSDTGGCGHSHSHGE
ncbi:MAG TPA: hypothetical protein VHH73_18320 [Verrucomicrobiae bacterium]|nr:hypothetical protein [Verrucomicrobiae bacterium]